MSSTHTAGSYSPGTDEGLAAGSELGALAVGESYCSNHSNLESDHKSNKSQHP